MINITKPQHRAENPKPEPEMRPGMGIKIAILGPLPPPYSGPEVMIQTLLQGISSSKTFQFIHINTQVSRSLADKGGRRQWRKALSAVQQATRLVATYFSFEPEIVYMSLTNSPSISGFIRDSLFLLPAIWFGKKIIIQFYGGYYFYAHVTGIRRTFIRKILERVNLAIVEGQRLCTVFNGLIPAEKITIVRHGRDEKAFMEACVRRKARVDLDGKRKRILFVGFLCRGKGVRDLIAAALHVSGAQFVFAGEWPSKQDEKEVRDFIEAHGIQDRIDFVGVLSGDNYWDLMASGDIFSLPSFYVYEGHAVATVDALAAGLPIICTDHGALNEAVRDGWNGFFVPKRDPEAVARRLNQLLSDDDLRRTMGERSRQLYKERFTLSKFVENWSRAIQRVAKNCEVEKRDESSLYRTV